MKYWRLLRVGLTRKKFRTALTIGSFAVAMFLFGLLAVVQLAFNQGVEIAGADRVIVMNKVSFIQPLPISYKDQLAALPGVRQVTNATWFGGIYQDEKNFFPQFAIDTDTWLKTYDEFVVSEDQWKTFLNDRQGAFVGETTAKRFNWKIGDRIPIKGAIFPGNWQFNIDGIYTGKQKATDTTQLWFHYDYLNESVPAASTWKNVAGWYIVRLNDPSDAVNLINKVDATYSSTSWPTKSATEKNFYADFAKQMGNIQFLILSIGSVVFFTLLLVTGNTMAISVRERTAELAILKAIGFSDSFVLVYVLAESLMIALLGGLLGLGFAKLLTLGGDPTRGMLPLFYLPMNRMIAGIGAALLVGALAGFLPALNASRLRVVEALRKV
jgi:putative ABC transport system permease protein